MVEALPVPWDTFFRLQNLTDTRVLNAHAHAREEALSGLLDELAGDVGPLGAGAIEQRYWALVANRSKKYRHRASLAKQVAYHQQLECQGHDQFDLAVLRELVTLVLAGLLPQDRELLHEVMGRGTPYSQVASNFGKPVGTVKARVSRLRRQIRDGGVARTVHLSKAAA